MENGVKEGWICENVERGWQRDGSQLEGGTRGRMEATEKLLSRFRKKKEEEEKSCLF